MVYVQKLYAADQEAPTRLKDMYHCDALISLFIPVVSS